jgi:hypothetical protein
MNWLHIIQHEEEEDDDEYFFGGDDEENMIVTQYLVSVEASGSHRKRAPDAPPRWSNKRDHVAGDAHICVDYFVANPVYSPMVFRRRYVRKLVFSHLLVLWRILTLVVRAGFVCVLMSFFDSSSFAENTSIG